MKLRSILCLAALAASASAAADSELDPGFGIFSSGINLIPINSGGNDNDMVADVLTAARRMTEVAPTTSSFLR